MTPYQCIALGSAAGGLVAVIVAAVTLAYAKRLTRRRAAVAHERRSVERELHGEREQAWDTLVMTIAALPASQRTDALRHLIALTRALAREGRG